MRYIEFTEERSDHDILLLLAERLKAHRLSYRLSQKDLAEQAGVSISTLAHFEQGRKNNMTLGNYIALLRALGMERRIEDVLPQLPMTPDNLKEIKKATKRVKHKTKPQRKDDD